MTKILSIGEVMLEMSDIGDGHFKRSYAGDTFNVAHYINVTTHGRITANYLTAVGTDDVSQQCLSFLNEMGVATDDIQTVDDRTIGLFVLSNDSSGEKQYAYWRGQSAARHLFDQPQDLSNYDMIYCSGITAAITENKPNFIASLLAAKKSGSKLVYDFNHRKQLWTAEEARNFSAEILPLMDIIKISDEELDFLYGGKDVGDFSAEYKEAEWVLTCGGEKAEIWQAGEILLAQKFTAVTEVVDTSAAGDAFIGTYLGALTEGFSRKQAVDRAHATASQVVCGKGSIVPIDLTKIGTPLNSAD